ncbi:MAG: hypothetical protein QOG20_4416 [Pseudonocardiales bacterium]|jgi:hypothetical protein|nr:hypothetical protein [Pseudonocardiales bacterium]
MAAAGAEVLTAVGLSKRCRISNRTIPLDAATSFACGGFGSMLLLDANCDSGTFTDATSRQAPLSKQFQRAMNRRGR